MRRGEGRRGEGRGGEEKGKEIGKEKGKEKGKKTKKGKGEGKGREGKKFLCMSDLFFSTILISLLNITSNLGYFLS